CLANVFLCRQATSLLPILGAKAFDQSPHACRQSGNNWTRYAEFEFLSVLNPNRRLSFNHLVGTQEDGARQVKAERLGALDVDHQLDLGRRLDRHVCPMRTLTDAA